MRNLKCIVLSVLFLFVPMAALAGDLDSPAAPTSADSAMYALEAIYNRLDAGTAGAKRTGAFTEPSAGPASTGHTLDDVMGKAPSVDDDDGAGSADVLSGKTFWGLTSGAWGTKTGTMANNGAGETITPGTSDQTVDAGYWSSANTVSGDTDLAEDNIRSGVTIFGVAGNSNVVNTSSGDAVAGEILNGKKAWVDGSEITGNVTAGSNVEGTNGSKSFTIPDGLYSGSKTATANDTNLVEGNIKSGVTIFGVAGSASSSSGVAKTGQTTSYGTRDDGALEKGVAWPDERFTNNGDGTVTDNLTGLMWAENANADGTKSWGAALGYCNGLSLGGHTDWRLPNVKELLSLIDWGQISPALPSGHPFTAVQSSDYWSSTTYADDTDHAWGVILASGYVFFVNKTFTSYVWPVRAGQ